MRKLRKSNSSHLLLFPMLSTVLQISLTCAVALQPRQSWTDSSKHQLSSSEGQSSEISNFSAFVHTEGDKSLNKCSCSTCTGISPFSAYPPFSYGYTCDPKQILAVPGSPNITQEPLEDNQPLQTSVFKGTQKETSWGRSRWKELHMYSEWIIPDR